VTRRRFRFPILASLLLGAVSDPGAAPAPTGWPVDTQSGVEVAPTLGSQDDPSVAPDGAGGVFLAWRQAGGRSGDNVYAQRLDAGGERRWGVAGAPVCLMPADQRSPQVVADGTGGVIVVWEDRRGGRDVDLYAQRLDSDGRAMWAADGTPVSLANGDQRAPQLLADGRGGAWVVWEDLRSGDVDLYAQRLDAAGTPLWSPDGIAVVTGPGAQASPQIVGDGRGGAIVIWRDARSTTGSTSIAVDVYAQRLDPDGNPRWSPNGAAVASIDENAHPDAIADGRGGVVVVWGVGGVTIQRIDSTGTQVWSADGLTISSGTGQLPALVRSGDGVMVTWQTGLVSNGNSGVLVSRVTGAGVVRDPGGLPVSGAHSPKSNLVATSDDAGGLIAVWRDERDEGFGALVAQRADSSGALRWSTHGAVVSAVPGFQRSVQLCPDGGSGVIAVWVDARHGQHIYAERLGPDGRRGGVSTPPASPAGRPR
jgi:hypothetical protein